jgi:hypothetical protein
MRPMVGPSFMDTRRGERADHRPRRARQHDEGKQCQSIRPFTALVRKMLVTCGGKEILFRSPFCAPVHNRYETKSR